ncbi:MAG: MerR family transcriptional regulator [Betaproteobacteria bacterium]|nr:MAG: MerR family transcriptional regulator [Betaproteobacteria bacterium]TAG49967.1 MAG: MerR family transcriptional regulator [Betaproteobacteria bacterium]
MPNETAPLPELPPIPAKRYFTIGEVSELCLVKPHVLRYWEQEFSQLRPVKRRGNRRYYQHHEVLLVRRIRELLYGEGFTIIGARGRLDEQATGGATTTAKRRGQSASVAAASLATDAPAALASAADLGMLKRALLEVADLLSAKPRS